MFSSFKRTGEGPVYRQISEFIKGLIISGVLREGQKLPSTREGAELLQVSRNTIIEAYNELEAAELVRLVEGQGAFVTSSGRIPKGAGLTLDWAERISGFGKNALRFNADLKDFAWREGVISFSSIAPDESIFDLEDIKRAFLNRFALEGEKLLSYGASKGYPPLLDYLRRYLQVKGVELKGKDLMITGGFTESFNLVLAALTEPGDTVVTENPTHNLGLNIIRLAGLTPVGIPMEEDGLNLEELGRVLGAGGVKLGFLIPSYHNPTGLVMAASKRLAVLAAFEKSGVPLVEEGFNEELRFSGSHLSPLIALAGEGNNVIHMGSLSKILFPGIRIGWICADADLIAYLESIKLHRNIYTSLLDQAVLFEYLQNGGFQQYLRRAKHLYKTKYELAVKLIGELFPERRIWGNGGLHVFMELPGIDTRQLLQYCSERRVLFTPGDIFYTDGTGQNTLRLSISRLGPKEMERGLSIIAEGIREIRRKGMNTGT